MTQLSEKQKVNKAIWAEMIFSLIPVIAFLLHGISKSTSLLNLLSSADISYVPIVLFGQTISKYLVASSFIAKASTEVLFFRSSIIILGLILSVMSLVIALERINLSFSAVFQIILLFWSIHTFYNISYVSATMQIRKDSLHEKASIDS
jgi:hypothetical protein